MAATEQQELGLTQLPEDVLQNVCQQLFDASDLARLASCSRACRYLVMQPVLWQGLVITRFGEDPVQQGSSFDVAVLRATYMHKSRLAIPAVDLGGVPAGEYQVVWRMMKLTGGQAGFGSSEVSLSVHGRRVHPSATKCNEKDDALTYPMQHFNSLPANQWHDICGGRLDINVFANITAKMWCHSGEWKHGLAWDCVRLVDVRQPVAPELQETISTLPADADTAVQSAQAAANWCRIA